MLFNKYYEYLHPVNLCAMASAENPIQIVVRTSTADVKIKEVYNFGPKDKAKIFSAS
jgi:hypothetical protein